ncbi:hypothetical protein ACFSCX_05965 [Bacillus salitolerans]|uniref:Uncharacterized protein n=1 Tax=Bacillus salitolerans TaxID=1437434 RepID=A0ABW4LNK8_9BACI
MKFETTITILEQKLFLERVYDVQILSQGQTIPLPISRTIPQMIASININKNKRGYIIDRPKDTNYEVYIINRFLRKPIIWVFKRSGEYINDKQFTSIDLALKWMNDTYIRDAEIKLNLNSTVVL